MPCKIYIVIRCAQTTPFLSVTCRNIEHAVKNGEVKFSNPDLSEGTIATVKCSDGWEVVGNSKLKCVGGVWDSNLPHCSESASVPLGMFMSG